MLQRLMDAEAEALVIENLSMAKITCFKLARSTGHWEGIDDLICVANEALCEAAQSYRPDKGATFRTWAYRIIHHRIIDYLRKEMVDNGGRGAPRGEYFATRVDDTILTEDNDEGLALKVVGVDEPGFEELEDAVTEREVMRDFALWLAPRMTEHQMEIYQAWLETPRARDISEALGITESRVSQIVKTAMDAAREYGRTVLGVGSGTT